MTFFRSIRWKLVVSYGLLTLLTVSLVGVMALSLIKHYTEQQEIDRLTNNAESVARQAAPLVTPVMRPFDLAELVHTSAFLGNARVKILDTKQRILADSGPHGHVDELMWIIFPSNQTSASFIVSTPKGVSAQYLPEQILCAEQVPDGTQVTVIHRAMSAWGIQFSFEQQFPISQPQGPQVTKSEFNRIGEGIGQRSNTSSLRTVRVPIGDEGDPLGYVELSRGLGLSAEALSTARQAFLLAAVGATLLAIVFGLTVGQRLTAPLRRLTTAASRMSGGDLSTRAPVRGKDEIGTLAGQFNRMARRLEASFAELSAERDALRRFITDASHQLRTPLTALKTFNELLQQAAADDPTARAEFLAESQTQLERLDWIIHNLLNLSRLDAGLAALHVAEHDAGQLIEASSAAFKTLAQEKGIDFYIEKPTLPLQIVCDRARIELALSNLLDNALKFTPAGGRVAIGAKPAGEKIRLWVRDSGPGVDPADQARIFERFYQGHNGQAGGAKGEGLGLAIVHSVVQAHGARVWVESQPGEGSLFVIELPSAEQPGVSR